MTRGCCMAMLLLMLDFAALSSMLLHSVLCRTHQNRKLFLLYSGLLSNMRRSIAMQQPLVITPPLLVLTQNRIRFSNLPEPFSGLYIVLVLVGMVAHRQFIE